MAIYLSRKKGGTIATPITPSNSSPAQMTANTPVNPTGNGYAIASYDTIFPMAMNPEQIEDGKIYQAISNGYAIGNYPFEMYPSNDNPQGVHSPNYYHAWDDGYVIESYSSVTPSSTPTSVSSGDIVKIGGSGVIVDSIPTPTSITPSNSSPVALTTNTPVNPTASGYAISSYSSKTPSDSSPASVSSGAIIKASASGYLYSSSGLGKCKAGTGTASSSANTKISLGFKPKYLCIFSSSSLNARNIVYDETMSTTKFAMSTSSSNCTVYDLGTTNSFRIYSIDNDGFTLTKWNNNAIHYFALG